MDNTHLVGAELVVPFAMNHGLSVVPFAMNHGLSLVTFAENPGLSKVPRCKAKSRLEYLNNNNQNNSYIALYPVKIYKLATL